MINSGLSFGNEKACISLFIMVSHDHCFCPDRHRFQKRNQRFYKGRQYGYAWPEADIICG